jgi:hypothetical protein
VETVGGGASSPLSSPPAIAAHPLAFTAKPVSLLDLPDEILSHVYDDVYHSLRTSARYSAVGTCVSLSPILVNKRIFRIVKPLFFQHLTFPRSQEAGDTFLGDLLEHREVHNNVVSVRLFLSTDFPVQQMVALSFLPNIARLDIDVPEDFAEIPRRVTAALKKLKQLRHLTMLSYADDFEDRTFSIDNDLPSLQTLDMDSMTMVDSVVRRGATRVQRFINRNDDVSSFALPSTIHTLEFRPDDAFLEDGDGVVARFKQLCNLTVSLHL